MSYATLSMVRADSIEKAEPDRGIYIATDASSRAADAAIIRNNRAMDWLHCNWSKDMPQMSERHINIKELGTVYLAINRGGPICEGKNIRILTDNMVTMYALRKMSIKGMFASDLLCKLLILCVKFNIRITPSYVATKDNKLPDALSRLYSSPHATYAHVRVPFCDLRNHMSYRAMHLLFQEWCSKHNYWTTK